jgi:hypothetical protein
MTTQTQSAKLGAPHKGFVAPLHTRTKPKAKEGLVLCAGGGRMSDFLDALGHAAHDPDTLAVIWSITNRKPNDSSQTQPRRPGNHDATTVSSGLGLPLVGAAEMGEGITPSSGDVREGTTSLYLSGVPDSKPRNASNGAPLHDGMGPDERAPLLETNRDGNLSDAGGLRNPEIPPRLLATQADKTLLHDAPPADRFGTQEARREERVNPWWPKPTFSPRYEADGRRQEISNRRRALWLEFPQDLEALDEGTKHLSKVLDDNCIVEWYQNALEIRRAKALRDTLAAKEKAAQEEARSKELATPEPLTIEDLLVDNSDRKIREWFTREELEKELTLWGPLPHETPETLLADWHRFENSLLHRIKERELKNAKIEGGTCQSFGSGGLYLRRVEGFSLAGAAKQQALVSQRQKEEDAERVSLRHERKQRLLGTSDTRTVTEQRLVSAVAVLLPQLRQPGNPQDQRQYHDKEWREAAGDAAKRSPMGAASTSSFETSGGATRKDLKDAERALRPGKPRPKRDSS